MTIIKPVIGSDVDVWGSVLNTALDALDAAATAAQARANAAYALGGGGGGGTGLLAANNLSDLTSVPTARTNLGLGGAALLAVGTTAGTVMAGDDARIAGAALKASNLSDLASAATARTNLGLGTAATQASTAFDAAGLATAAQAAAILASAQRASNLSDLASASTARTNLGLGGAAVLTVGTTAGTVAAGDDSRFAAIGTLTASQVGFDPSTTAGDPQENGLVDGQPILQPIFGATLQDALEDLNRKYFADDVFWYSLAMRDSKRAIYPLVGAAAYTSPAPESEFIPGIAPLDGNRRVPVTNLGSGSGSSSVFLDGTGAFSTPTAAPSGAAGGSLGGTYPNPTVTGLLTGSGAPEGVTTATVGVTYQDTTNGQMYRKGSGSGNTGWVGLSREPDVQVFTAGGTWTKPTVGTPTMVYVEMIAPGGGGGSGARTATAVVATGGGGGSGGSYASRWFPAAVLGATESVGLPAGGAGGAAQTVDSTAGNNGSSPSAASFGATNWLRANGGNNGGAGQITAVAGSAGGAPVGMFAGGVGAASIAAGTVASAPAASTYAPSGGGAGGGNTTGNAAANGGVAGTCATGIQTAPTGGVVGGASPTNASVGTNEVGPGLGGAGGAASLTAAAQAGANGGNYGAGGGGGGASRNGFNSGAGGNGATGIVRVVTFFSA